MNPPVALTIAGSDSGAGAGIQADLKAFAANGVFGTSAVTALTAQNTVGVQGVHVAPPEFVDAQIASVLSDFDVKATKTGMLATANIISVVAARAKAGHLPNLVVDPVMVAAGGDRLLDEDAEHIYVAKLFPHARVITPNLWEASMLVGREIASVEEMKQAAEELAGTGTRHVIVKGGHLVGDEAVDIFYNGTRFVELRALRVDTPNVHGTGCTFASAIAANLAKGTDPLTAARNAKAYLTAALRGGEAWRLGAGHGPVDHFRWEDIR